MALGVPAHLLQVAREQRPVALDLAEVVAAQTGVLVEELTSPEVAFALVEPEPPPPRHARTLQRQVLDRIDESVVLEQLPLLPLQPVELASVERAETAPEDEVLRGRNRRNRVHLEEAEAADGLEDVARRAVEQLCAHGDSPRLLQ